MRNRPLFTGPRVMLGLLGTLALLAVSIGATGQAVATGATCPSNIRDRVTTYSYTVTRGGSTFTAKTLDEVQQGDSVQVQFTIADGCSDVQVALYSYTASGNTHETGWPQHLFDQALGTFNPGTYSLGPIDMPDCYFQADIVIKDSVNGGALQRDVPDATLGGTRSCSAAPPTPTPTPTASPGGETSSMVMVMKHVCPAGMTVAQFNALPSFAEKVFTCPVITLPGDTIANGQARDARDLHNSPFSSGEGAFDFGVAGGGATMMLSTDATFEGATTPVGCSGADCVEVSHYGFDMPTGVVTVTETTPPANYHFGTVLFTPNSGDDAAFVSVHDGVIVLDTSKDSSPANGVMLHVYNFTGEENVQGATGTPAPSQGSTSPEQGVQGATGTPAGSLANTSIDSGRGGDPLPTVLFSLIVLLSLGGLAYTNVSSARRRD